MIGTKIHIKNSAMYDSHLSINPQYVITLLKEKKLHPENISEELLMLKNEFGVSILDICIERFHELVVDKNHDFYPRALYLSRKSKCCLPIHFRKIESILKIADKSGWSVAHEFAVSKKSPKDILTKDLLKLTDQDGYSVGYAAAEHGNLPEWATYDKEILMLDDGNKNMIISLLVEQNALPLEMMTPDILTLKDTSGLTILDSIIKQRNLFPEILLLPWNENMLVFEYLCTKQSHKNMNKEDLAYIDKEFAELLKKHTLFLKKNVFKISSKAKNFKE